MAMAEQSADTTNKKEAANEAGATKKSRAKSGDEPTVIKKYANRRLYNTGTSSYVTLEYLSDMVKNGEDFVVFDAKSGDDITRSVLTQIIFEEENKGQNLLPIQFLRKLIQYYGDSMQSFVPSYLDMSMETFSKNHEKFREQMRETFGAAPGYNIIEETTRANMAMFENAIKMFSPRTAMKNFYGASGGVGDAGTQETESSAERDAEADAAQAEIEMLRSEVAELRRQLASKPPNAAQ